MNCWQSAIWVKPVWSFTTKLRVNRPLPHSERVPFRNCLSRSESQLSAPEAAPKVAFSRFAVPAGSEVNTSRRFTGRLSVKVRQVISVEGGAVQVGRCGSVTVTSTLHSVRLLPVASVTRSVVVMLPKSLQLMIRRSRKKIPPARVSVKVTALQSSKLPWLSSRAGSDAVPSSSREIVRVWRQTAVGRLLSPTSKSMSRIVCVP
jgi:hypothetical protein